MSSATLATTLPSGVAATRRIHLRWAFTSRIFERDSMYHQTYRPSYPPETSVLPASATPVT